MTVSGSVAGGANGSDNLRSDRYLQFADYLTEVTKLYRDRYNITFRTLEATNEPDGNWWVANSGKQEGCGFNRPSQVKIVKAAANSLKAKGLSTVVSASDQNRVSAAVDQMKYWDTESLAAIQQVYHHLLPYHSIRPIVRRQSNLPLSRSQQL